MVIGRQRPAAGGQRGEQGGAGRRRQLERRRRRRSVGAAAAAARPPPAPGWAAGRGRPRTMPSADGDRAGAHLVDAEHLEGGARADDVDDGVERADLVEVDARRRSTPWRRALGLGQRVEDGQRPARGPGRAAGRGRPAPRCRRAVRTRWSGSAVHDGPWWRRCRRAARPRRRAPSRATGSRPSDGRAPRRRSAPASSSAPSAMSPAMPEKQWNQATVGHAPAPARWSQTRATAQAAPKPLSMPTTVMPGGARGQHGQQRGDALEAGAVAGAGRHGDDRRAR